MTSEEEDRIWMPAAENLFGHLRGAGTKLYQVERALERALAITEWSQWQFRAFNLDKPMSPELKELLIMLAGPHGKAILRAYQIKHDIEVENAE